MLDRQLLHMLLFHDYIKTYYVSSFSNVLGFHLFMILIEETHIRPQVTPYFCTTSLKMCQKDIVILPAHKLLGLIYLGLAID